jgi:hypothetical protein
MKTLSKNLHVWRRQTCNSQGRVGVEKGRFESEVMRPIQGRCSRCFVNWSIAKKQGKPRQADVVFLFSMVGFRTGIFVGM